MPTLTREERFKILQEAHAAEKRGDREEAHRMRLRLPLPVHLAEFMKKEFGAQYLIDIGANLSEVEALYGI
jgi:hypothetical protein